MFLVLSLILDLLTMCFAAANANEEFLESKPKQYTIVLAVMYGKPRLCVLLVNACHSLSDYGYIMFLS